MTLTVNREIFLHPDFTRNLDEVLCSYLNSLIDAELCKDDADFDFIDECADAINSIRSSFQSISAPVISDSGNAEYTQKRIIRFSKAIAAVAAAMLLILTANTAIASATEYNIIEEVSRKIAEIFTSDEKPDEATTQMTATTTTTTTTTVPSVTKAPSTKKEQSTTDKSKTEKATSHKMPVQISVLVDIEVGFEEGFKREYYVGEQFDPSGLIVYGVYNDGYRRKLDRSEYNLKIPSGFGRRTGSETIEASIHIGIKCSFTVQVVQRQIIIAPTVPSTMHPAPDYETDDLPSEGGVE